MRQGSQRAIRGRDQIPQKRCSCEKSEGWGSKASAICIITVTDIREESHVDGLPGLLSSVVSDRMSVARKDVAYTIFPSVAAIRRETVLIT